MSGGGAARRPSAGATGIRPLFDENAIAARIDSLAGEIVAALPPDFVVVGMLKGSFVFVADLTCALYRAGVHPEVEFLRLSSYGLQAVSSGTVHVLGDIPGDIGGRSVLLVDDIADTGRSIAHVAAMFAQRDIERLSVCVLLNKPSRREVEVPLDFVGFEIDDLFVAGYGIDYAERFRHLPYIGVVEPEAGP